MAGGKHGRTVYFIEGEGVIAPTLPPTKAMKALRAAAGAAGMAAMDATPAIASAADVAEAAPEEATKAGREFRFGRMFPGLAPGVFDDTKLIALGKEMEDTAPLGANAAVPAGFTYLGQFVDHDITFDKTEGLPDGSLDPEDIVQGRSPSLDLDSVYGMGPDLSPELYESDKLHLRLGDTTGRAIFGILHSLPNDVPRHPPDLTDPNDRKAIIGDPRNDENLAVSQTHVAFLKFHNKVIDTLSAVPASARFEMAREIATLHYQSVVLHDFVGRIADPAVLSDVLTNGRKIFLPGGPVDPSAPPAMPVEFSGAGYRIGHSLIRNGYQWNKIFNSNGPGPVAGLDLLFLFSRVSGDLQGSDTLPTDWTVDWRRLYDFSEVPGGVRHPQMNFARLIDPNLARDLEDLPEFAGQPEERRFLSVRNLLRGRLLGLPTGQDVAAAISETGLTAAELGSGPQGALVASLGFDTATPLWYYLLKEAEVQSSGLHLGKVGSRIVVETFHALIEGSQHSILRGPTWTPTLPSIDPTKFQMTDLLTFVDDINPLGD